MRDEDDRGARFLLEIAHQLQDLGLYRHVKRGCRLVGDQQARVASERHRDHDTLPHPARQFVRVIMEALFGRRNANLSEHLHRALDSFGAADVLVS